MKHVVYLSVCTLLLGGIIAVTGVLPLTVASSQTPEWIVYTPENSALPSEEVIVAI